MVTLKEKCEHLIKNEVLFESNNCGQLKVIEYINGKGVVVQFIETWYKTITQLGNVIRGSVRDRLKPSVCGVGVVGVEVTRINGQQLKEYEIWSSMLKWCYNIKTQQNIPTYKNCEVSGNFKYFPYFKDWCNNQIGFNQEDWQLDKDILIKGNKVYSEDPCCFVPQEINTLFTKSDKARGEHMIGVSSHGQTGKFHSRVNIGGEMVHLGLFETELEAFYAYKEAKEERIKHLADKWKDQIDLRVYNALMNYQVETTD